VQRNWLEGDPSTQVRLNLVVEWPRVARTASVQTAKSNHEAAGVSSSSGGLAGGSEILQKALVWLVLEDPQGSCELSNDAASVALAENAASVSSLFST
jgi:hypothetical protein